MPHDAWMDVTAAYIKSYKAGKTVATTTPVAARSTTRTLSR